MIAPESTSELDGEPVSAQQLTALALTGYGHFTTMRVENGRVRGLALHLDRLTADCWTLFGAELDPERVRDLARRAVPALPAGGTAVVRVTVFDPAFDLAHPAAGSAGADPHVLVTSRPAADLPLPPLRVQTRRYVRDLPGVKSVGLFGQLVQRRAAQLDGYDDALFIDDHSHVGEGATWNVGFVDDDGTVVWPAAHVLDGVTMRLLQQTGPHVVRPVLLPEMARVQAAFATNAAIGVRAIARVDDVEPAVDHPVLGQLRRSYLDLPAEPL